MTHDENGLLPCPLCGSKAELYHAAERTPDYDGSIQGHWVVDCSECNASLEFLTTKEEAEKTWNTRTPVIPAAEIDEAMEAFDRITTREPYHTVFQDINKIRSVLQKMRGV